MSAGEVLKYKIEVNAELQELGRMRSEWKQTVDQLTLGLNISIGGALLSGIHKIGAGFQQAAADGLRFGATIEDLEASFTSLMGSQGAALMRLRDLQKFAAETPFKLPEIATASRVLQTLTKGALASGDGLTMVGNVAAATGRDFRELAVHVGRLYDGLNSGREVGRSLQELQQMGVISGDVRNKIERMQKTGAEGSKIWAVAAAEFGRFAGEMDRKSKTLNGLTSTLADTWNAAMSEMMASSAAVRKDVLKDLIKELETPETRRALRELGQDIAKITKAFGDMAVAAAKNADKLGTVANALIAIGKAWMTYKIGSLAIGGASAVAARMAGGGASAAAQGAAAGAVATAGVNAGSPRGAGTTIGGVARGLNLGLSIGILVKSLIDDQTDSVKAQAAVFRTINEENDLIAAGLKKQIGTMETLAEKTELQGQIIGEIRRLERERNDSPELSWMQKKLGIADQTRGAYDAQITRLQTILTLSEEVADVDLMRKELAARVARNRDESDAIVATRKESEKNASVTNRKEALSRELARIQNETARASVKTRMAGGDESAEIAASVSGIDQQIAAVNTAIQDLQSELGRTEGSLDGLRDSNAQAFGTALEKVDDLKKAIPELQQELDSLQTQRMEEAFRATKTEIEKTGQALRDMVPQGLDSFTAAATAGARGDAATLARIGGAGVRMDAPVAIRRDMDSAPNVARQGEKDLITNTRETVKILQRVRDLIERQEAQGTYVPVFG